MCEVGRLLFEELCRYPDRLMLLEPGGQDLLGAAVRGDLQQIAAANREKPPTPVRYIARRTDDAARLEIAMRKPSGLRARNAIPM